MLYTNSASEQPGTGAANTQPASLDRGKRPLRCFAALIVAVLMATMILTAAPVYAEETSIEQTPALLLVSTDVNGTIDRGRGLLPLKFRDEDILSYDPATGAWSIYFDGATHGLGAADLEDFEVLLDGDILFTLEAPFSISGFEADDSDVIRYDAASGTYSTYLSGDDIGLTYGDEAIDALACLRAACTTLLISTIGAASYGYDLSSVLDEDLVACVVPAGPCTFYFDGSDLDLHSGNEDVNAAWQNENDNPDSLWLSTKGHFYATSRGTFISGDNDDVFGCRPGVFGIDTACSLFAVFNADTEGFTSTSGGGDTDIDGLWATFGTPPPLATVVAATSQTADTGDADDVIAAEDFAEAMSLGDPEVDVYDFFDVVQQIYLPIVNR
jgi:hypothetical protein